MRRALLGAGLADHQGAADLRVVALDAGRELGRDQVAALEPLAARRRHAANLDATDPDDLEIVVDAVGAKEGFGFGDQLVVRPARARRVHEHPVAVVGNLGGAADRGDLGIHLAHQQAVDEGGLVGEIEVLGARRDPARDQALRRRADPLIAQPVERAFDFGDEIGGMDHLDARTIQLRAVDLERAVEIERGVAIVAHQRQRLAFEDAEIGGVAQIVALPGIAVDQQRVEARFRHCLDQTRSAVVGNHEARLRTPR